MTATSNVVQIWTLESRDNTALEVMEEFFGLDAINLHSAILAEHASLATLLAEKGCEYALLKSALVPDAQRREVALFFDADETGNWMYGVAIADKLLPLLPRKNFSCSILVGDLIAKEGFQDRAFEMLNDQFVPNGGPREYVDTSQIYAVYLSGVPASMIAHLVTGLSPYSPFIGYADVTFSSPLKNWLSVTLVPTWIKRNHIFIGPHEDDAEPGNYNLACWPLEENNYELISVPGMLFEMFLAYKIERMVIPGEVDNRHSLAAINSQPPIDIEAADVVIGEDKLEYIRSHKGVALSASGLRELTLADLQSLVQRRLHSSYFYDLRIKAHPGGTSSLFSMILEFPNRAEGEEPVRLTAGFELMSETGVIKLTTLF